MDQTERMNSASNDWEADPWDASDEVAEAQLAGFNARAIKPIAWTSIATAGRVLFGMEKERLRAAEVAFHASHDGEDMLLMQLDWHGFPDPPEWRLATRPCGASGPSWESWGYFADLPRAWTMPSG